MGEKLKTNGRKLKIPVISGTKLHCPLQTLLLSIIFELISIAIKQEDIKGINFSLFEDVMIQYLESHKDPTKSFYKQ